MPCLCWRSAEQEAVSRQLEGPQRVFKVRAEPDMDVGRTWNIKLCAGDCGADHLLTRWRLARKRNKGCYRRQALGHYEHREKNHPLESKRVPRNHFGRKGERRKIVAFSASTVGGSRIQSRIKTCSSTLGILWGGWYKVRSMRGLSIDRFFVPYEQVVFVAVL